MMQNIGGLSSTDGTTVGDSKGGIKGKTSTKTSTMTTDDMTGGAGRVGTVRGATLGGGVGAPLAGYRTLEPLRFNIMPINDLPSPTVTTITSGFGQTGTEDVENILKCKLASVCRLIHKYKMSFGIYNHVSVRSVHDKSTFLINPFGLGYEEVTASSLMRIDKNGKIVERGSTSYGINKAGFILHSAIHENRPDINCVLHVHTQAGAALSAIKQGLLPISQEAMIAYDNISYHAYEGILNEESFKVSIGRSLGQRNKLLILHNHGVVSCGATVEEAWAQLFDLVYACETELKALSAVGGRVENLVMPNAIAIRVVQEASRKDQFGLSIGTDLKFKTGELEFEAEMRSLDSMGYRTGYPYKVPINMTA